MSQALPVLSPNYRCVSSSSTVHRTHASGFVRSSEIALGPSCCRGVQRRQRHRGCLVCQSIAEEAMDNVHQWKRMQQWQSAGLVNV